MVAIILKKEEGVATITLNRPQALNALNQETFAELRRLWPQLNQDEEVRVAILTGAGRAFCAGADIKEMAESFRAGRPRGEARDRAEGLDFLPINLEKPLIAAVNGAAAGGGLGLALFSDIIICSHEAIFVAPYAARGVMDSEVVAQLVRRVSPGWALWMAFSGDRIDAQTALRIGLTNEVLPRQELLPRAVEMAEKIMQNASLSVLAIKEKMKTALATSYREAMAQIGPYEEQLRQSSLAAEGFIAAAEKRRPGFE